MATLTRYLVPCITEGIRVTSDYRVDPPTSCPNNNTHDIDVSGIVSIDSVSTKTVTISQASNRVQGMYRADGYIIPITPSTTTIYDITYPYNIGIINIDVDVNTGNIGDNLTIDISPTSLQALTVEEVTPGSTVLHLDQLSAIKRGYLIEVTDGTNTNQLGQIISVDNTNNTIACTLAAINTFAVGSEVRVTSQLARNLRLSKVCDLKLGQDVVNATIINAGEAIRIRYDNTTSDTKSLNIYLEIMY